MFATPAWSQAKMLMPICSPSKILGNDLEDSLTHTRIIGGSRDTAVKALTARPTGSPLCVVVTTTTPVGNCRFNRRAFTSISSAVDNVACSGTVFIVCSLLIPLSDVLFDDVLLDNAIKNSFITLLNLLTKKLVSNHIRCIFIDSIHHLATDR